MAPSRSQPEFFLDRSLGGRDLARALRKDGWIVRTHLEVFGERDQSVADVEWLGLCGQHGWPALTMDRRIRYRPAEIDAIRRHRARVFALASGNLAVDDQAARLIRNRRRIELACESEGPLVYAVHASEIVRIFPA